MQPSAHLLQALTTLTAAAANNSDISVSLSPGEWETLFSMACQQNVAALVCDAFAYCNTNLPLATKLKFITAQNATIGKFNHARSTLSQMLALFNSHGINTMLLKGITLARLYPKPNLRSFGDIDFYQYGRWREADALMVQHYGVKVSTQTHHHSKYAFNNILIENHYDFINRYGARGNMSFERLLKTEANRTHIPFVLDGQACFLPPPTFSALFYLRHMAAHFAADRITLRHLLDWTFFCRSYSHDVDWQYVVSVARQYGFLPFAACLEELCRLYFQHQTCMGLPSDKALAERAMHEILVGEFSLPEPSARHFFKRISFKWRRRIANRWKRKLCTNTPWAIDIFYDLFAKILKPHTILH